MPSNPVPPSSDPILGLILAGGRASRMGGGDKALLRLGDRPMLAHVAARLGPQVARLALSANGDPARFTAFGLPVLPDAAPDWPGPLAGMLAGLDFAASEGLGLVLAVAADTPFLPRDLAARLGAAVATGAPLAFATAGGRDQPTCALLTTGLREPLRAALGAGAARVGQWMRAAGGAAVVFPDEAAFFNVNTPADLDRAEAMLAAGRA